LRVALVEPYFDGSHRAWAEGLAANSDHDIGVLSLPAAFWKWRMQGGYLTLADAYRAAVAETGAFDLILATSMLHLAGFLGALRREAPTTPAVLYMHENQLTYPVSPRDREDLTYPFINWTSMAVADEVWFNSAFHHDQWFERVPAMLRRFPDTRHDHLLAGVQSRSRVVPLGVDLRRLDAEPSRRDTPPLILWNQRWDHDKGPDELAAAIRALDDAGASFRLAICGETFATLPSPFEDLKVRLGPRLVQYGYAPEADYRRLLRSADIVLSTARQEFFGIAITEAVYAGAFPVLPRTLVYPERIPPEFHDRCLYRDEAELLDHLRWALTHTQEAAGIATELGPAMAAHDWTVLAPSYDDEMSRVAAGVSAPAAPQ
jgi:glycosyltransferase involved in cell wall biosynthesis